MGKECWHKQVYGTCENCEVKDLEPELCPKKNGHLSSHRPNGLKSRGMTTATTKKGDANEKR